MEKSINIDLKTQRILVKKALAKSIIKYDKWSVFSFRWFQKWKLYVNYNSAEVEDHRSVEVSHPSTLLFRKC